MNLLNQPGARLAYAVIALQGTVKRSVTVYDKTEGLQTKEVDKPAGFLVYFPRGHVLRFETEKQLKHYGLDKPAAIINLSGLNDPQSPLGRLMAAQDDETRRGAMHDMKTSVMRLATANTGQNIMPEMLKAGEAQAAFIIEQGENQAEEGSTGKSRKTKAA